MSDLNSRPGMGLSALQAPMPFGPTSWEQSEERLKREQATTTGDYVGAMMRQDGIVDGVIAHYVGQQMAPDQNYSVYDEAEWKELTEGVWPEFHKEFGSAHSAAHARYLKDRLLQKQEDLTKLGDLGVAGNVGRLALGVLAPENLVTGYVGGVVSRGLRLAQLSRGMSIPQTAAVARAAEQAGRVAQVAQAGSKATAVAGGVAAGALENAALEKLRQSVNFEDDSTAVLEAALIGAAFTTPFALAGARAQGRVAKAAEAEHKAMKALAKVESGEALTPDEARTVDNMVKAHEVAKEVELGRITPEEAYEKLTGFMGPRLPDEVWLERFGDDLRSRAELMLDEMFPDRVNRRTEFSIMNSGGAMNALRLGYDPSVKNGPMDAMVVGRNGQAYKADMTPADVEASLRAMAAKRFKSPKDAEAWVQENMNGLFGYAPEKAPDAPEAPFQPAGLLGYDPNAGRRMMVGRDGRAFPAMGREGVEELIREMAAKKFPKDPEKADRWAMEQRASMLGYAPEVATKVKKAKAERQQAAQNPPKDPSEVIAGEPSKTPEAPAPEAPAAPKPVQVEDVVDWTDRNGNKRWGMVESIREDGWLMVRDEDGNVSPVNPARLDRNVEPPEGFLGGSIGAAQIVDLKAAVREPTSMRKARIDYFSILDRSQSEEVRDLSFILIKDPIQSNMAQGMTASEWKSHIRRTIGGLFHVEARAAAREAAEAMKVPMWGRAAFYHEFHSMVSRLTRGDLSVTMVNKDIAPMLQRASAAQKEVYRKLLEEAKAAGVKGTEEVDFNEFYVNRVWNHRGIDAAIEKHGADAVHKLLATAINVPGFIGDAGKAARFLATVRKLEFSKVMQNVHLYAQDMGTLRNLLAQANLDQDEIDLIVDTMFEAVEKDAAQTGRAANLKYRFDIEETLSINLPTGVLRISDLFENDARVLVDTYLNTMGGHIGLAKVGITSEADFQARIKDITNDALEKGLKGVPKDVQYLQDIYSNIVGRPMSTQDFSGTARVAAAFRGYTRSVSLGQLGLTAAFEMKQAVGLMGFRAFWTQLPSFRQFITALRNGYIPDKELAKDIMQMTGFGTEMSSSYARAQEIDDGFLGQTLLRVEDLANKASHITDIMSGNASFTSLTRQLSGMMAVQRVFDFASGRVTGRFMENFRERAVGWGVDKDSLDNLLDSFKKHVKADPSGRVDEVNWEDWLANEPGYYQMFQTLVSRMTRDAIQDQDLGEMVPFMHQTLGKLFGELKTFFMVAHAKNMLKNLHYRDATALQLVLVAFLGEMLAYATQVSVNHAQDPAKRDELLTPEKIALSAFFRSPVNGMVPFFAETFYQIGTGGESLVSPDMTASGNGRLLIPPSVQAMQRLYAAPSSAAGILFGTDNVTQQEGLNLWKTLPLSNMLGARNLGAILTEALPERESQAD